MSDNELVHWQGFALLGFRFAVPSSRSSWRNSGREVAVERKEPQKVVKEGGKSEKRSSGAAW